MKFVRIHGRVVPIREKGEQKQSIPKVVAKAAAGGGVIGALYGWVGSDIARVISHNSGFSGAGANIKKYSAALIKQQEAAKLAAATKKIPMSFAKVSDNLYSLKKAADIKATRAIQSKVIGASSNVLSKIKSSLLLAPPKKWILGGAAIGAGLAIIGKLAQRSKNKK